MNHMRSSLVAAVLGLALAGSANAQYSFRPPAPPAWGPGYTPSLSPYLRLTLPGDTATNYYLGTVTEFKRREAAQELRSFEGQTRANEQALADDIPQARPLVSGTAALTNNTGGYFNNTGSYFGSGARPTISALRAGQYNRSPGTPVRPSNTGFGTGGAPGR
jgi:hypothetical protein